MDKRVTIRLTDQEIQHCNNVARGNLSYYIRELIQRDMQGNVYVPVIAEAVREVKPVKSDFDNDVARDTISKMFNF